MDNYNQLAILIGTKWELGGRRTAGTANGMTPGAGDTKANLWPGKTPGTTHRVMRSFRVGTPEDRVD